MTEYEEFMKYLEMHHESDWVSLKQVSKVFPNIQRKTIDRLLYNGRVELQEISEEGEQVRLTKKGREKLLKKNKVKTPTVVGAAFMVVVIFMFKIAPKMNDVYLDNEPGQINVELYREQLDSILKAKSVEKRIRDSLEQPQSHFRENTADSVNEGDSHSLNSEY